MEVGKKCSNCLIFFKTSKGLRGHIKKCEGFHALQCKICLKKFASSSGKFQHIKYIKCVAPSSHIIHNNTTNITDNSTTNNNLTTNNIINSNNLTNNNQQYITNNIRLCFGSEDLEQICKEEDYMNRIEQYVHMLKYALPKSSEDVFFNEKYPNNQTIKKDGMKIW
jgi:hypothetical protein